MAAPPTGPGPGEPVAYVGGRVFTGEGFEPGYVVVGGGRVVAVEPGGRAPAGVRRVDCAGLSLLPGWIDAHVHLQFTTPAALLAGGVTTVRDLGGPPGAALALRGRTPLRVLAAGRILTAPGGYPTRSWGADGTGREVADPRDAARAVAEQAAAGAAVVKVALEPAGGPLLDEPTLRALVDAAHRRRLRVSAHVGSREALTLTLDAGVDELAHLPLYDVTPAEMLRCAEAGVAVVPTLQIRPAGGRDPVAGRALAAFRDAGGRVVYGSDLGNAGTAPGIAVAEVAALLAAGMRPAEIVHAATAGAADWLGLDAVGRLAPGQRADLVAVAGAPDEDPAAYADVRLVMAGGTVVVQRRS